MPDQPTSGAKTFAETASAILGALTAAAALVVVPGAVAMYLRLDRADLPADLGVVVSLPSQFLFAIGLAYVLFPLLILIGMTMGAVLGPGPPDKPNPALFEGEPEEDRSRWGALLFGALLLLAAGGLPWAVDSSPPWWSFLFSLATAAALWGLSRAVAGRYRDGRALGVGGLGLTALVAATVFLPWAVAFAVFRGELPPATVCRPDGDRLDGFLVGEAENRVYIGEIPNRVVLFLNQRGTTTLRNDVRAALRSSSYDVRLAPSPNAVTFGRVGLVVVDVAELTGPGEAERLFDNELTEHVAFLAVSSDGSRPFGVPDDLPLFETATLRDRAQLLDRAEAALKRSANRERPRLRITSVPSGQVSRLLIGSLGPCPAVEN